MHEGQRERPRPEIKCSQLCARCTPEVPTRAQVHYEDVVVYATAQREWKQCAAFQDAVVADLTGDGLAGNVTRIGTTGLRISHAALDIDHIMDLATGLPVGVANNTKANYTLFCLPAADGLADPALAGARAPAALMRTRASWGVWRVAGREQVNGHESGPPLGGAMPACAAFGPMRCLVSAVPA